MLRQVTFKVDDVVDVRTIGVGSNKNEVILDAAQKISNALKIDLRTLSLKNKVSVNVKKIEFELTDKSLIKNQVWYLDGKPITEQEMEFAIAFLRSARAMKKKK